MALKVLMLRKELDTKNKRLEELRSKAEEFDKREKELEAAIEEAETDEERAAVEEMVNAFDAERGQWQTDSEALVAEIGQLTEQMEAEEAKQNTEPQDKRQDKNHKREDEGNMKDREFVPGMTMRERLAEMVKRDDVKAYLGEVRTAMREKRAITNIGLTIPEVLLGLLKEKILDYSKLYKHVTVRRVSGTARLVIMGPVPEAIWTDCCANLNELALSFADVEVDCYKVGGYFAVCNANMEDSDVDLAAEIMSALGQAIGLALDKAILYGRNTSGNQKMPMGIVSRLVQTAQPSGYPPTARTWEDLHETNVITIPAGTTGAALIAALVTAFGAAKNKYGNGAKVWLMNEATYTAMMAGAVSVDAQGRIVTGMASTMPVVGGVIETLNFLPDNVIIAGYFDLYYLIERAGQKFASSEHVRFLQDQTVYKGTARYDGVPVIPEGFVAIGINGVTPTADMTFPADTAN